ncbi:response regulator transcription factor [Daejeonella lutea]|uniref:DNA-binding response regulator, NarL/FixJ family, contains REC and HTH domains n=1 Tax=Daejeonella lutea TaxID=572036 RepID=A0A1T5CWJ9_9SPHI|nr:response regulator transcription factor [Daejeonella lutea]SKB63812.1 DNA-binding response regulator, NarL/FixJ family, contains REC and HTH domains [Daejeonella lutea]
MINIVLLAGRNIVCEGISRILNSDPEFRVIAEISNFRELDPVQKQNKADVLIIDQDEAERSGIEPAEMVKLCPGLKTLLLTEADDTTFFKYYKTGITAFVCKDSAIEELAFAIRQIVSGSRFVCTNLVVPILNQYVRTTPVLLDQEQMALSAREREILDLIAEGYTNQEIADKIFTSKRTVEGHRLSLLHKTGSRNTASLICYAVSNRLINIRD